MKSFLVNIVVPFILQLYVRFTYLTSKKIFHHPVKLDDDTYLVAFWHGEMLMQYFNYKKLKPHGKKNIIISDHRDGELIAKIVSYAGIDTIRGSSTRGGVKVLLSAIKEIKNGNDVWITPDGPKGPRHNIVADGIVSICKKTNAKILILNYKSSKFWQLSSWDKFFIPKPFGKLEFFIQEPLDISGLEQNEAKELIRKNMLLNTME